MIEKTKLRIQYQEEGMLKPEALVTNDNDSHKNFILKEVFKIKSQTYNTQKSRGNKIVFRKIARDMQSQYMTDENG